MERTLFRNQLPRLYELKDLLSDSYHPNAYFRDFENHLQDRSCFATYALWEKDLQSTDPAAWEHLKGRASRYLKRGEVKGREWQQLFDTLGEASGCRYLKECAGCSVVRFIPESNGETPDLEGICGHNRVLCEVKTMNISDDEVRARRGPPTLRKVRDQLGDGFFSKLDSNIAKAARQMQSYDPNREAQHLVYIKVCFDDWGAVMRKIIFARSIDTYQGNPQR
jgi:hypothetical protein